ncbi:hypothetical protein [Sphingobacterium hungaricum]|nr:hypothetical protein [Sphingobacterium hungaricum]
MFDKIFKILILAILILLAFQFNEYLSQNKYVFEENRAVEKKSGKIYVMRGSKGWVLHTRPNFEYLP